MSGTDTAIAELNEPTAAPARPRLRAPRHCPTCPLPTRAAPSPGTSTPSARRSSARCTRWTTAVSGTPSCEIGDGVLYLADEYPELGLKAPDPQASSVSLMLHVTDTDATLERAREHGRDVQREPYENYGARNATIVDPFGHRWMLSGPVTGAPIQIQHGDVGYVSVWTPDADRAAAFYGHVLGWNYDPETHQVTNTKERIGIYCVAGPPHAVLLLRGGRPRWRTASHRGRRRIRSTNSSSSTSARCSGATDPQGTSFAVFQPNPGQARPELNGSGPGELSYITYEVTDSGRVQGVLQPGAVLDLRTGPHRRRLAGQADPPDGRGRRWWRPAGHRADVDCRGHRRRRRAGARGGRDGHRRTVAAALRQVGAVHRRPGQPLLPGRAT